MPSNVVVPLPLFACLDYATVEGYVGGGRVKERDGAADWVGMM